jgi:hypothetical protein
MTTGVRFRKQSLPEADNASPSPRGNKGTMAGEGKGVDDGYQGCSAPRGFVAESLQDSF